MLKFVRQSFQRLMLNGHGLLLGILFALFSMTSAFPVLEDRLGLHTLFLIRGAIEPPAEVVVVNIDNDAAQALNFSDDPNLWPRSLHAALIKKLQREGVELIGFNVFFGSSHPDEDGYFAQAMKASNAVLGADLFAQKPIRESVFVEEITKPTPLLADAMLNSSPSLLMTGAETEKFITWYGAKRETPTLAVRLLQYHLLKILAGKGKSPVQLLNLIQKKPAELLRLDLSEAQKSAVLSLIDVDAHREPRYFNHYGPYFDIRHIPYQNFFSDLPDEVFDLQGKIVLVGFSENFYSGNTIGDFDSPFSSVSSLDLLATAFANLLDRQRKITQALDATQTSVLIFFWSVLLGACVNVTRFRYCFLSILILTIGFGCLASWQFNAYALLWPFVFPVAIQPIVIMLVCLFVHYHRHKKAHENAKTALDHMLPNDVVKKLIQSQKDISIEETFGACMATDIGNYTALAEKMGNRELRLLMDAYFKMLFCRVKKSKGIVSDVVGDAIMVFWRDVDNLEARKRVLAAALDIQNAVEQFQQEHNVEMPIRIGLNCGPLQIGFYGGEEHSAFRATGDAMNVVSRIESINKLVGTRILVSAQMMEGLHGFAARSLGQFNVQGKSKPIHVFELLDIEMHASFELKEMLARFGDALKLCQDGAWKKALTCLAELGQDFPEDGPTRFFERIAETHDADPLVAVMVEKQVTDHWVADKSDNI